jgi:hypothetical protein
MPNSMKDIMMEYTTNMHGHRDITLHVHLLILIVGNLIQFNRSFSKLRYTGCYDQYYMRIYLRNFAAHLGMFSFVGL